MQEPEAAGGVGGVGWAGDSMGETPSVVRSACPDLDPALCVVFWSPRLLWGGSPPPTDLSTSHRPPYHHPNSQLSIKPDIERQKQQALGSRPSAALQIDFKNHFVTRNQRDSRMMWKAWRPQSRFLNLTHWSCGLKAFRFLASYMGADRKHPPLRTVRQAERSSVKFLRAVPGQVCK